MTHLFLRIKTPGQLPLRLRVKCAPTFSWGFIFGLVWHLRLCCLMMIIFGAGGD